MDLKSIAVFDFDDLSVRAKEAALKQESDRLIPHHRRLLYAFVEAETFRKIGIKPDVGYVSLDYDHLANGGIAIGPTITTDWVSWLEALGGNLDKVAFNRLRNLVKTYPSKVRISDNISWKGIDLTNPMRPLFHVEIEYDCPAHPTFTPDSLIGRVESAARNGFVCLVAHLCQGCLAELQYQRSEAVLTESIIAEGFQYLANGRVYDLAEFEV
jgi:hypothetical protein